MPAGPRCPTSLLTLSSEVQASLAAVAFGNRPLPSRERPFTSSGELLKSKHKRSSLVASASLFLQACRTWPVAPERLQEPRSASPTGMSRAPSASLLSAKRCRRRIASQTVPLIEKQQPGQEASSGTSSSLLVALSRSLASLRERSKRISSGPDGGRSRQPSGWCAPWHRERAQKPSALDGNASMSATFSTP